MKGKGDKTVYHIFKKVSLFKKVVKESVEMNKKKNNLGYSLLNNLAWESIYK